LINFLNSESAASDGPCAGEGILIILTSRNLSHSHVIGPRVTDLSIHQFIEVCQAIMVVICMWVIEIYYVEIHYVENSVWSFKINMEITSNVAIICKNSVQRHDPVIAAGGIITAKKAVDRSARRRVVSSPWAPAVIMPA
jgi:hypothetical protein